MLSQYIQAGFAGFVYNYKDFDLARTAVHLVKKHNYPYGCFQISFTDMEPDAPDKSDTPFRGEE